MYISQSSSSNEAKQFSDSLKGVISQIEEPIDPLGDDEDINMPELDEQGQEQQQGDAGDPLSPEEDLGPLGIQQDTLDQPDPEGEGIFYAIRNIEMLEVINRGIAYAIIISFFLSIAYIFVGGITFILSGGDQEKITKSINTIRNAIIGLIISVLAVVIVATVGNAFGLDITNYIQLGEIYDYVSNFGSDFEEGGVNSLD